MKTTIFIRTTAFILLVCAISDVSAASLPPAATTLPAATVTPNQATLTGAISPSGQATSVYFRYGLTTNYGSASANIALPPAFYPPTITAIAFNGSNQNAVVPGFGNYAPTNEITIEFWQNAGAAQAQSSFTLDPNNSANRINSHVPWLDNGVYWDFGNISGAGRLAYTPTGLIGVWNHMAMVASQSGNSMVIYRNGVLESQKSGMTPFTRYAANLLLAGGTVNNYYFKGALAEFRVWNKALDQSTIQSWMNHPLDATHPAWTNLLAYWPMNEGSGSVLNDQSGHGHTAFLSNAPVWMVITNSQVSVTITGLSPTNTYHYQVVATNASGVSTGSDLVFVTPSFAGITWSTPTTISGDFDVFTGGVPVYAYDWANISAAVNGVNFTGITTSNGSTNVSTTLNTVNTSAFTSASNPFGALSGTYKHILEGSAYNTTIGNTVTLNNLVAGHTYAVQVWVNDPRGPENGRTEMLSNPGGNQVTLAFNSNSGITSGTLGQFTIGTFAANSSVQTFSLAGNVVDQINALQLRDLTLSAAYPIATTGEASNLRTTGATLYGSVNPNGLATTAWFQWGTSAAYGNSTAAVNLPAGFNPLALNADLSSLTPGTTYHFAVTAVNSTGTNQGIDQIFSLPVGQIGSSVTPVLFSTFGPNYSYSYMVESRFAARAFYIAMPFSPKTTAPLGHILVPVYNVFTPSQIRFTLTTDNGGVPGATLETWSVVNPTYGALTTLKSVNTPMLTKGVQYWLVANADDPSTESYWWIGPLDGSIPSYNLYSNDQGASWNSAPVPDCAFEVDAANPIITSIAVSDANLTLTASSGVAGHTYVTLMGTNINQPRNLWQPVATNLLNLDGAFTISAPNAASPTASQRYYILKMQ